MNMQILWSIIGITVLAGMGGTGLGGVVSCLFRKDSGKTVSLLLSFAAGVMTSVVCFDLLTEALHPKGASISVFLVVLGLGIGYIVIAALSARCVIACALNIRSLCGSALFLVNSACNIVECLLKLVLSGLDSLNIGTLESFLKRFKLRVNSRLVCLGNLIAELVH